MRICEEHLCTGCFACSSLCPHDAISMKDSQYGFLHPDIDEEICTECGACVKVCPVNTPIPAKIPVHAYACWSSDDSLRATSTSGGLATVLSHHIIEQGGVVYGAAYSDSTSVVHIRVDDSNDLARLQGSKYVQSNLSGIFRRVKIDLQAGVPVLFVGTPCQVAGLKNYLKREYELLYCVDLICHGVPGQAHLNSEVEHLAPNIRLDSLSFRGDGGFHLRLFKDGQCISTVPMKKSPFYRAFFYGLNYRESCYYCSYAQPQRVSDITIGDFWGIGKLSPCEYVSILPKGISVALPITGKGLQLFSAVKDSLFYDERPVEEAIQGNAQLQNPSVPHPKRSQFLKDYTKVGGRKSALAVFRSEMIKEGVKEYIKETLPFLRRKK